MSAHWSMLTRRASAAFVRHGFDLIQPFRVGVVNQRLTEPELRLPDFSRPENLGLVIGNTRAFWPHFRAALARDPGLARERHPLDCYTTRIVEGVLAELGARAVARFAHELVPAPVPIQRIAHFAGLAWLSPSHLSIHREHGPWIALRAVIVVDVTGPDGALEPLDPCTACSKPCLPALDRALAEHQRELRGGARQPSLRPWLAVRDACPVARERRYDEDQIDFHYARR